MKLQHWLVDNNGSWFTSTTSEEWTAEYGFETVSTWPCRRAMIIDHAVISTNARWLQLENEPLGVDLMDYVSLNLFWCGHADGCRRHRINFYIYFVQQPYHLQTANVDSTESHTFYSWEFHLFENHEFIWIHRISVEDDTYPEREFFSFNDSNQCQQSRL